MSPLSIGEITSIERRDFGGIVLLGEYESGNSPCELAFADGRKDEYLFEPYDFSHAPSALAAIPVRLRRARSTLMIEPSDDARATLDPGIEAARPDAATVSLAAV